MDTAAFLSVSLRIVSAIVGIAIVGSNITGATSQAKPASLNLRGVTTPTVAAVQTESDELEPIPQPGLSTETSTTTLLPSGEFEARISTTPINYFDKTGRWAPIDSTLVAPTGNSDAPATDQGGVPVEDVAAENAGAAHTISVPQDAAATPLRLATDADGVPGGEAWVTIAMQGLSGRPTIEESTATFDEVEGADAVQLQSTATGLKETIVLDQPPALAEGEALEYRYSIQSSDGIVPILTDGGVVEFIRDAAPNRTPVFTIPVGNMFDSAETITVDGAESLGPAYTNNVTYSLAPAKGGANGTAEADMWDFTLTPDMAWLSDPARVYPVMIDPDVKLTTNSQARDCSLWQDQSNSIRCGDNATHLHAGRVHSGASRRRSVLYFNAFGDSNTNPGSEVIPASAEITHSNVQLWLDPDQSMNPVETGYVMNRTSKPFTNGATYNSPDNRPSTNPWGQQVSGGGPIGPDSKMIQLAGNEAASWRYFNIDEIARGWHADTYANNGLVLKQRVENVYSQVGFLSSSATNAASRHPQLNIRYRRAESNAADPEEVAPINEVPGTVINDPAQATALRPGEIRRIDVSDVYSRAGIVHPLDVDRMRLQVKLTGAAGSLNAMIYNSDLLPPRGPVIAADDTTPDDQIAQTVVVEQASDDHITVANNGSTAFRIELTLTGWQGWDDPGDDEDLPLPDDDEPLPDITADDPELPSAVDGPGVEQELDEDEGGPFADGGGVCDMPEPGSSGPGGANAASADVTSADMTSAEVAPDGPAPVVDDTDIYCLEPLATSDPEIQEYLDDPERQARDAQAVQLQSGDELLRCPGGRNRFVGNRWYSCQSQAALVTIRRHDGTQLGKAKILLTRRINADPSQVFIVHKSQVRFIAYKGKAAALNVYQTFSCKNCPSGGGRSVAKPADFISAGRTRIGNVSSFRYLVDGVSPLYPKSVHFRATARASRERGQGGSRRARFDNSSIFRCDDFGYMNRSAGCVVRDRVPIMDFPASRAPMTAETIRRRINQDPFPGRVGGMKLERELSPDVRKRNRRAANRYCRITDVRGPGQDCDEYPFSSTSQGCASAPRLCYARYINGGDNRRGGGFIGAFYSRNRVYAGEGFWIKLVN